MTDSDVSGLRRDIGEVHKKLDRHYEEQVKANAIFDRRILILEEAERRRVEPMRPCVQLKEHLESHQVRRRTVISIILRIMPYAALAASSYAAAKYGV